MSDDGLIDLLDFDQESLNSESEDSRSHGVPSGPTFSDDATTSGNARGQVDEIIWHDFHCDPVLDVVLRSSDNVYFRASSHHLKRESYVVLYLTPDTVVLELKFSTMFNGMLSAIPNDHMRPEDAISLDCDSTSIGLFLDAYATQGGISSIKVQSLVWLRTDSDRIRHYRNLVYKLDCARLRRPADKKYDAWCKDWPFEALKTASQEDDTVLAKNALGWCATGFHRTHLSVSSVFTLAEELRSGWRGPFLRAVLEKSRDHDSLVAKWPDSSRVDQFIQGIELIRSTSTSNEVSTSAAKKQKRC